MANPSPDDRSPNNAGLIRCLLGASLLLGGLGVTFASLIGHGIIFFYGAEFTREYAVMHGSKQLGVAPEEPAKVGEFLAANDEHHLIDRAKAIVKGKDPILTRKEQA